MNIMCRSIGFIMVVWLTATVASCENSNMPLDTPLGCGDSVCAQTESCESCPEDCGACPTCGDGACNGSETCSFCPADCGECAGKQCGNSICDEEETCESCSLDCGQCPPAPCGNGTCASDESCESCPEDCGSCPEAVVCGDAICSGDENCDSCPADCGACGATGCRDGIQNGAETGVDCGGPCLACDYPQNRSYKRGVSYNFCDWSFSKGQADLDLLAAGDTPSSGVTWYYNWGYRPNHCIAASPSLKSTMEYVPMVWTLHQRGVDCSPTGKCFGGGYTTDEMIALLPENARYLLGFNEPNFIHQANLTPTEAAGGWKQMEAVADTRGLSLVGPAVNYCDPTPGANHGGACTRERAARTFTLNEYSVSKAKDAPYNIFDWLELFYDECSSAGSAGFDCRIDYQAVHVYSYYSASWILERMKIKAGLLPPNEAHCSNGTKDNDEFNTDCGGNACKACTEWARTQFSKPVWVTEFAPAIDDAVGNQTPAQIESQVLKYIDTEVAHFENDPFVARYAWFMPKTDISSLDHVDLLTEKGELTRTPAGEKYINKPH